MSQKDSIVKVFKITMRPMIHLMFTLLKNISLTLSHFDYFVEELNVNYQPIQY